MEEEPNPWEQSARIVEAFSAGVDDDTNDLLGEIAAAIREKAVDD